MAYFMDLVRAYQKQFLGLLQFICIGDLILPPERSFRNLDKKGIYLSGLFGFS